MKKISDNLLIGIGRLIKIRQVWTCESQWRKEQRQPISARWTETDKILWGLIIQSSLGRQMRSSQSL